MPAGAQAAAGRGWAEHCPITFFCRRSRPPSIMKPHFPFVRIRPYPNSFVLAIRLCGAPTRRDQRAFFATLHAEARHQGMVMGHKFGLCVFFGAERLCTSHSRHQMINWLIDHEEVRTVEVSQLVAFADVFASDPKANPLIRALRDLAPELRAFTHVALLRAAYGTLVQWAAYLGGRL
jgi:hypothetical protein